MSTPLTEGRLDRLVAFRLSDLPTRVLDYGAHEFERAAVKGIGSDFNPLAMYEAIDAASEVARAAEQPSDRVYWIREERWNAVARRFKFGGC